MGENEQGSEAEDQHADDREQRDLDLALGLVRDRHGRLVAERVAHRGIAAVLKTVLFHFGTSLMLYIL